MLALFKKIALPVKLTLGVALLVHFYKEGDIHFGFLLEKGTWPVIF